MGTAAEIVYEVVDALAKIREKKYVQNVRGCVRDV
jgi:hypothetical protein